MNNPEHPAVVNQFFYQYQQMGYTYVQPHEVNSHNINQQVPPTCPTIQPVCPMILYWIPTSEWYPMSVHKMPNVQTVHSVHGQSRFEAELRPGECELSPSQEICNVSVHGASTGGFPDGIWRSEIESLKSSPQIQLDGEVTDANLLCTYDTSLTTSGPSKSAYGTENSEASREVEVTDDNLSVTYDTSSISSGPTKSSCGRENCEGTEQGDERVSRTCLRSRRLLLKWSKDGQHLSAEQIDGICSRFKEHGFTVEVPPVCEIPGTFEVIFESMSKAWKALCEKKSIGYKLDRKWFKPPKKGSPGVFKVLSSLTVRKRRQGGQIVTQKSAGDTVYVDGIRGRRARLMKGQNDHELLGWASLFTKYGEFLLEQLVALET